LIETCHDAWHGSSSQWDNVVGSSLKDMESRDPDLECPAIKLLCTIPVEKMIVHLQKERINLLNSLTSPHVNVKKQTVRKEKNFIIIY
jgi:hypothetical protein